MRSAPPARRAGRGYGLPSADGADTSRAGAGGRTRCVPRARRSRPAAPADRDVTGSAVVVVDLRRVSFLDSTILGTLVGGLRRMRERGGELKLVYPLPPANRIFALTGLDALFPVAERPTTSLEALAKREQRAAVRRQQRRRSSVVGDRLDDPEAHAALAAPLGALSRASAGRPTPSSSTAIERIPSRASIVSPTTPPPSLFVGVAHGVAARLGDRELEVGERLLAHRAPRARRRRARDARGSGTPPAPGTRGGRRRRSFRPVFLGCLEPAAHDARARGRSSRETCICEMPTSTAISDCVRPSKKRSSTICALARVERVEARLDDARGPRPRRNPASVLPSDLPYVLVALVVEAERLRRANASSTRCRSRAPRRPRPRRRPTARASSAIVGDRPSSAVSVSIVA